METPPSNNNARQAMYGSFIRHEAHSFHSGGGAAAGIATSTSNSSSTNAMEFEDSASKDLLSRLSSAGGVGNLRMLPSKLTLTKAPPLSNII